jgi:hypothetical protein
MLKMNRQCVTYTDDASELSNDASNDKCFTLTEDAGH